MAREAQVILLLHGRAGEGRRQLKQKQNDADQGNQRPAAENRLKMMNVINGQCRLRSDAKGIVFPMPVGRVTGFMETACKADQKGV